MKILKRRLSNILTYFRHPITNAVVEGLNSKLQSIEQMTCGFRNGQHYRQANLFHSCGPDLYGRASALGHWSTPVYVL
ncbi:MAG: transposase [Deltaproteobacteria bacterium]|nr:transposase [Deltaproteobacteria bacterium]